MIMIQLLVIAIMLGDCQPSEYNTLKPSELKSTHLLFASGETNPLLFLNQFEKCIDVKSDKDKMYNIRHFVDESHKAEISKLFFTSDWQSVRSAFLRMYTVPFLTNKKREMDVDFEEASTLRSFMERKLMSLSKFTTLPFLNQMEIALNDLPTEISSLFIVNEKMTCKKSEILDFCDSIEELVDTMREKPSAGEIVDENEQKSNHTEKETDYPENRFELFNFIPQSEPEVSRSEPEVSRGRGRGRGRSRVRGQGRGRPSKKSKTIIEEDEDDERSNYSFLNQMDNTSRSSWSDSQMN